MADAQNDTPITTGAVHRWFAPAVAALTLFGTGLLGWAQTQFRITSLEQRVSQNEAMRQSDREFLKNLSRRISRIDRKLALLVCKSDPNRCSEQELAGIDDP